MTSSLEHAEKITKCTAFIFDALVNIRRDASMVILANERDDSPFSVTEAATRGVNNLACVVEHGTILRSVLSFDIGQAIAVAVAKSDIERPAVIPIDKVCCADIAKGITLVVARKFGDAMLADGGYVVGVESWTDPKPYDRMIEDIKKCDDDSAVFVLESLVKAVDETKYTDEQLDLLCGVAKREGAALVASLTPATVSDSKKGNSYFDIAMFEARGDEAEAKDLADSWRRNKVFAGLETIGKDPNHGTRALIQSAELSKKYCDHAKLDDAEKTRLNEYLRQCAREPKKRGKRG